MLLENHAFHLVQGLARRGPSIIPRLARFTANRWGRSERIERSDQVFASPRLVKFAEMEYGVPASAGPTRSARSATSSNGTTCA